MEIKGKISGDIKEDSQNVELRGYKRMTEIENVPNSKLSLKRCNNFYKHYLTTTYGTLH